MHLHARLRLRNGIIAVAAALTLLLSTAACGHDHTTSSSSGGSYTGGGDLPLSPTPGIITTTSTPGLQNRIQQILDELNDNSNNPPPASANSAVLTSPQTGASQLDAAKTYLTAVINDADTMWSAWFKRAGLQEPSVEFEIVEPGQSFTSKCTSNGKAMVADTNFENAFFCSLDVGTTGYHGTIVLPLNTFLKMWSGNIFNSQSKQAGDFAAATIAAHEFGHHVADELQRQGVYKIPTGDNAELEADCFSGVWARTVYAEGKLETGDVTEAEDAIYAIGDYEINNPGHHGTPAERLNAWQIGYYGLKSDPTPAKPLNCMVAFGGNTPVSS